MTDKSEFPEGRDEERGRSVSEVRWRIRAVFLLVLLAACGSGESEGDAGPAWAEVELRQELSIGVSEGPDELMFGRVAALAVSPSGRIYVADSEPTVIRAYSPDGEYSGTIGREGQGPGEYGRVAGMAALPDGGVAVWDWGNRRLTAFRDDGTVAWSTPAQSSFMLDALTVDKDGVIYLLASEGQVGDASRRYVMRRYTPSGEEDGLIELPTGDPPIAGYGVLDMIRGEISNFETGTVQAWSPHGYLVTSPNDEYRVAVERPDGPVVLTRDLQPVALQGPERDEVGAFVAWVEGRMAEMGREVAADPVPDYKPLFRAIEIGQDGRVWLRRYVAAELDDSVPAASAGEAPPRRWREPTVYDVWEPDGTFMGTIRLPAGMVARKMSGDLVWGTRIDSAGVERIVRYRIIPDARN